MRRYLLRTLMGPMGMEMAVRMEKGVTREGLITAAVKGIQATVMETQMVVRGTRVVVTRRTLTIQALIPTETEGKMAIRLTQMEV